MIAFSLDKVACAYDQRSVLSDISFEVNAGEIVALIGPNGVGKTTLLRTMARLMRPVTGKIYLMGQDLWQPSQREIARKLAYASQSGDESWDATVEQTVALGRAPHRGWFLPLNEQDREVVNKSLEQVGITALRKRNATRLSGGEKKRVNLARVLAQEASVLLLDEPTAHLDLKYQTEILNLVHRLAHQEGMTVIVSLHDLNQAAMVADRVVLLHKGGINAIGTAAEVMTQERLSAVYGVPILVMKHSSLAVPVILPNVQLVDSAVNGAGNDA